MRVEQNAPATIDAARAARTTVPGVPRAGRERGTTTVTTTTGDAPGRGVFRSLRHSKNLRIYLAGHCVSTIGTWAQRVAQDWLVLEITDSSVALGISVAVQFIPMLVFAQWGGLLVDRLDRRRTIMVTQVLSGLLAAGLAVITLLDVVQLWSVLALGFGLGLVTVVDVPARQAFVAAMVEPADYANAQALASSINNAGRLVGPALAGMLIAGVGLGAAFVVNAASFGAVVISLLLLDVSALRPSPRIPRRRGQIREGARYLWNSPSLRATMILVAVVAVFGQNFRVVLPLAATELYGGNAATYGWLTSAMGLGALLGAVISATATIPTAWSVLLTTVAFGAANLVAAFSPILAMALLVMVAVGITNITFNTLARSVLLLGSDPSMHGRMMAFHGQVFLGSTPIGGPLVGWLCAIWGARAGFLIAAGTALLAAVLLIAPLRRARRGAVRPPPERAHRRRARPDPRRDVTDESPAGWFATREKGTLLLRITQGGSHGSRHRAHRPGDPAGTRRPVVHRAQVAADRRRDLAGGRHRRRVPGSRQEPQHPLTVRMPRPMPAEVSRSGP